jgi:hypothetical protein
VLELIVLLPLVHRNIGNTGVFYNCKIAYERRLSFSSFYSLCKGQQEGQFAYFKEYTLWELNGFPTLKT